jgi:hypothetical protein
MKKGESHERRERECVVVERMDVLLLIDENDPLLCIADASRDPYPCSSPHTSEYPDSR